MEEIFKENTSLFGFKGVIGRKDFFLNRVIISAIALIFTLPYQWWLLSHLETAADIFNSYKNFTEASFILKTWVLIGFVIISILGVSNIIRRTRDIKNEENSFLGYIFSGIFVISLMYFILPLGTLAILLTASFIMHLILLFKKGEITGKYPYDYKKEFNWGAFLGTWIWGLFNKSYKPLWMLLLWLTPFSTHFALYCGLKGNEWAFKNKNYTDVEEFNKAQRNQTTIFAILLCTLVPILYFAFILIIAAIIAFAATSASGENANTQIKDPNAKIESILNSLSASYFEKHEITDTENKFYVSSKDWVNYSYSNKKDILDLAASMAASEKNAINSKETTNTHRRYSKSGEITKTKIYSNETGELLGEFVIDEETFKKEKLSPADIFKAGLKAYRFYRPKQEK